MAYEMWKTMHFAGVVLFLGNIIVTAVWKVLADRHGIPDTVAFGQKMVTVTDWGCTLPGAILVYLSGHLMAMQRGGIFAEVWLTTGWLLFIASGVIWVAILIPIQIRQARLAKGFSSETEVPETYRKLCRYWVVVGTAATLLPVLNLYFMTLKPGL